jgi:hypothetical protein
MSVCVYSACAVLCVVGSSPRPRSPTDCVKIKKLKKQPRTTGAVEPEIRIAGVTYTHHWALKGQTEITLPMPYWK